MESREPLTRPSATLSPSDGSDGERAGLSGHSEIISGNGYRPERSSDEVIADGAIFYNGTLNVTDIGTDLHRHEALL